ncbi:MAG: pseudouridine-5'-phosphate glycosidase [Chloroflexi bacterium]|nr:pseudouridine-5'-phosphate glycosidase [Chloroflexota bacterium]
MNEAGGTGWDAGRPAAAGKGISSALRITPEVAEAIARGRPVVALESTLITHGFPYPENLQIARDSEAAIRAHGAVPATVAVRDGRLLVGLSGDDLEALATSRGAAKVSRPTLAAGLRRGGWGATTVSATMIAAHAAGIRVFATGGIGGVHRGALVAADGSRGSLDISADLDELARTPVAVVCAGPKLILDVPLTVEALETRGVPVVTIGSEEVPGFWSRTSGVRSPIVAPDIADAAGIVSAQLGLGLGSGLLVCAPVPESDAVPREVVESAIGRATAEAGERGVRGADLTPWLLARIADLTEGASVRANLALIRNNAGTAAAIAALLSD